MSTRWKGRGNPQPGGVRRSGGPEAARPGRALPLAVGILLLAAPAAWAGPPPGNTPEEIEIGRQVVTELESAVRLAADSAAVARLTGMAERIAPTTERPLIHYEIKLIESPISNALSVPGGTIYFTTGMLKEARSDEELAGVMAHEIAHNTRQHALVRMERGTTQALRLAELISLGIFLLTKGGEWGQAAQLGVGALTQSVLSAYSVEDEKDADERGLRYLLDSGYDPVGFLTFMERQATLQSQLQEEQMGFFRTHPFSGDRVLRARRMLESRGIPLFRRLVNGSSRPAWGMARRDSGQVPALLYEDAPIYFPADGDTASSVARRNAGDLAWMIACEVPEDSLRIEETSTGGSALRAGEKTVEFTAQDGAANGRTAAELARDTRQRLALIREQERRRVALLYYLLGGERE